MKLAEALMTRAEYQTKIENLQQRIIQNSKVQDGDEPHEDPLVLLTELEKISRQLCDLIKQINAANTRTLLEDGRSLSEAIVDRDMLKKKRIILSDIISAASEKDYRLTHAEIKINLLVNLGELQRQMDDLARQYRELDALIQSRNWLTDL